jgi:hypothetical protein
MKIDYSLSPEELKAAVEQYLVALGHPVATTDSFVLNPDGTVTVEIAQESPAAILPPKQVGSSSLPPDPPYSITGRATIFGLNYDGSVDKSDNGQGFFGYNTRDKSLIGASVPEEVLIATLGLTGLWGHNAEAVLKWAKEQQPVVMVWSQRTGKSALAALVDVGPALSTGNALDRTYGLCEALGDLDNGICTYCIDVGGKPIELKGWK